MEGLVEQVLDIPMELLFPIGALALVWIVRQLSSNDVRPANGEALPGGEWPYRQKPVMTETERRFFAQLLEVSGGYVVLAQVQMSAAIAPPGGRDRLTWLNRIHQKSFDFLICSPDLDPLVAIELDDASHRRADRKRADARKNRACAAADLRLERFPVSRMPSTEVLATRLNLPPLDGPQSVSRADSEWDRLASAVEAAPSTR